MGSRLLLYGRTATATAATPGPPPRSSGPQAGTVATVARQHHRPSLGVVRLLAVAGDRGGGGASTGVHDLRVLVLVVASCYGDHHDRACVARSSSLVPASLTTQHSALPQWWLLVPSSAPQ